MEDEHAFDWASFRKEREEAYRKRVAEIGEDVLKDLTPDRKEGLRKNPYDSWEHFGLGLYIRNTYIHGKPNFGYLSPDNASGSILDYIYRSLLPEYQECPLVFKQLSDDPLHLIQSYMLTFHGRSPVAEVSSNYSLLEEAESISNEVPYSSEDGAVNEEWKRNNERARAIRKRFQRAIADAVWDFPHVAEIAEERLGIDAGHVSEYEAACRDGLDGNRTFISFLPSDLIFLLADEQAHWEEFNRALDHLAWTLKENRDVSNLPGWLFVSRRAAEAAVKSRGLFLKRIPSFEDDEEIVRKAIQENPNAISFASPRLQKDMGILRLAAESATNTLIFDNPVMKRHKNNRELVKLSLLANGANIAHASKRLRNDLELGLLAVNNKRDIYPFSSYEGLGDSLKKDRRIALAVASWPDDVPYPFPDESLADDDEIGELLSKGDHFRLVFMSRRIKEKYMTEEELGWWGDDPH